MNTGEVKEFVYLKELGNGEATPRFAPPLSKRQMLCKERYGDCTVNKLFYS